MKKRIFSLLLVLVLAASALNITASAYSDYASGVYRGKNYSANLYVCKDYVRGSCTYAGGGEMFATMNVIWSRVDNPKKEVTKASYFTGSSGYINTPWDASDMHMIITKATDSFNVKFGTVCSLIAASY